jgi:hypothetical protein
MIPNTEIMAGLYMGEGHFSVSKSQRKNKAWQFTAEIGFSNSDPALIDAVCSWLEALDIHHYIRQNSQGCYQLAVQHYADILKLVKALEPHLFGSKKAEAALVKRFIEHRTRPKEVKEKKMGNNQFNPIDQTDHDIVAEKRNLRESSETKSIPVCCGKHGHNGSTYRPYRDVTFNDATHKWIAAS